MSETPRIFDPTPAAPQPATGAEATVPPVTTVSAGDDFDPAPAASPMDDLIAELGTAVERVATVTYQIEGRPGWWARFDIAFTAKLVAKINARATTKRGEEPDALKAAFLLIAETCQAIGKDDTTVFEPVERDTDQGRRLVGPFLSGAVEQALGGRLQTRPGEKSWQAAIRHIFGAQHDDMTLVYLSGALQSANRGELVEVDGRPTD